MQNEKAGIKRSNTILYYDTDGALFQIVSCYLSLARFRVVSSLKSKDVLQKLDRQKFNCIVLGPDSESVLHLILENISRKDSLNHNTKVVVLAPADEDIQIESEFASKIGGVVKKPYTLASVHKAVLVCTMSSLNI